MQFGPTVSHNDILAQMFSVSSLVGNDYIPSVFRTIYIMFIGDHTYVSW